MARPQTPRPAASRPARAPQANAYQSNSIMTASPGKLLLMLYDGAIKFCNIAEEAIAAKDIGARSTNLIKVQDILTELRVTLDHKPDPIFAEKMSALYIFFEKELMLANIENNAGKVRWVKNQLIGLRDTWAKVIK
jgi:flagellar protein FliS